MSLATGHNLENRATQSYQAAIWRVCSTPLTSGRTMEGRGRRVDTPDHKVFVFLCGAFHPGRSAVQIQWTAGS